MRGRLLLLFAVPLVVVVAAVGLSEAACSAKGDFRVTGPNVGGFATLTETVADASTSSGKATVWLFPKGGCSLCDFGGNTLSGEYLAWPGWDGGCFLELKLVDPVGSRPVSMGGSLAFGGAVIFFEGYSQDFPRPGLDLNLTLGIRSDAVLRP